MIPISYFVAMCVVNKVKDFICHHAQHRSRPSKSVDHVRVSAGISKSAKQLTKSTIPSLTDPW